MTDNEGAIRTTLIDLGFPVMSFEYQQADPIAAMIEIGAEGALR